MDAPLDRCILSRVMANNPLLSPGISTVSAMITPSILILAAGSLVASTLVRLGRVVDQSRALIARGAQLHGEGNTSEVALTNGRLQRLVQRAELVRRALWGYYVAIAVFLLSSISLALNEALRWHLNWLGPFLVLAGGVVLMFATFFLVIEVTLSAGSLREEVISYERLTRPR